MAVVVAIDAGTTGVRSMALSEAGLPVGMAYREFTQHFPRPGWVEHDATVLMENQPTAPYPGGILVDQGLDDKFLAAGQLRPELLEAACAAIGQPLTLRRHVGYDHGYYFVQSVVGDHLAHHARQLGAAA